MLDVPLSVSYLISLLFQEVRKLPNNQSYCFVAPSHLSRYRVNRMCLLFFLLIWLISLLLIWLISLFVYTPPNIGLYRYRDITSLYIYWSLKWTLFGLTKFGSFSYSLPRRPQKTVKHSLFRIRSSRSSSPAQSTRLYRGIVLTFRSAFALIGFRYEANLLLQHKQLTFFFNISS